MNTAEAPTQSEASKEQQFAELDVRAKQTEELDVLPAASDVEDVAGIEKVNSHEGDVESSVPTNNPPDDTEETGLQFLSFV